MNTSNFALITGASSGIGEACANTLAKEGKPLILVARRKDMLDTMKVQLEQTHPIEVLTYGVDLANQKSMDAFFSAIACRPIDILINNAGLALGKSHLTEYAWQDLQQMIDVNIKAFTRVAQMSIPYLKKTRGHIVNISSIAGIEAYEGAAVYCATKAFVKMMSKALRLELVGTGVRVSDIAPGAVKTNFSNVRFKGDDEKAQSVYQHFIPLVANDIAEAILFALTRPPHVNIDAMLIMPTAQASATRIVKTTP